MLHLLTVSPIPIILMITLAGYGLLCLIERLVILFDSRHFDEN